MDLFTALLKSTKYDYDVIFLANFVICLIGFIWVAGAKSIVASKVRWFAWLIFWLSTSIFYLLKLSALPSAVYPFFALDISLVALLVGAVLDSNYEKNTKYLLISIAVLFSVGSRVTDILNVSNINNLDYGHALVITFSFLIWGWIHRAENITQSLVLIIYGLMQLPFLQIVGMLNIDTSLSADKFVSTTYVAYFVGKFALIIASYSVISSGKNA